LRRYTVDIKNGVTALAYALAELSLA